MALTASRLRDAAKHFGCPDWTIVPVLQLEKGPAVEEDGPVFPYALVHSGGGQVVITLDGSVWRLVGRDERGRPLRPPISYTIRREEDASPSTLGRRIEQHVLNPVVTAVTAKRVRGASAAETHAALDAARRLRQELEDQGVAALLDEVLKQCGIVWVVPKTARESRAYVSVCIDEPETVSVTVDMVPQERAASMVLALLAELERHDLFSPPDA